MPIPDDIFRIAALGALAHMPPDHPATERLRQRITEQEKSMPNVEMHCGMCEHDWSAPAADVCPACGSDEIETLAEARTHNHYVILRETAYADCVALGFAHDEATEFSEYLARTGAAKIKASRAA